uniref:Uncharacterized protein n=1 Tax=Canis lupus familiaris TaxID=9615 RepID=A0A8I3P6E3_CANLF
MPMKVFLAFRDDPHPELLPARADCRLVPVLNTGNTVLDVMLHVGKSVGLCLAFVESRFNISKGNENADGSFQINSHYWCNDDRSHSENICHEDCQGLPSAVQKKDCLWSRGYEELGSMEVALCRPATLLLDDRMFLGMRQDTGLP